MTLKSHSWVYMEKNIIQKDTCTSIFILSLFTIARSWKQPKCSLTDEWIKMWYIYTMVYCSVIKKTEIMSCTTTWMHLEIIVLYEVGEKDKYCMTSLYVELKMIGMNLLIKQKQTHRLNEFMVTKGKERTSLVAQTVKRLPTMQETRVRSLG